MRERGNTSGTEIGKVRGLGAAGAGTHHWWAMRLTSIASLVLGTWFLASLVMLPNFDQSTVTSWLKQPLVAVPMVLFAITTVYHQHLGLQELIADYAHDAGWKVASQMALTAFSFIAGFAALFSILKIALGA